MLPFMHPKKAVSVIIARRGKPDVEAKSEIGGKDLPMGLEDAAADILRAMDERSVKGLADALQNAFQICDAAPHEEGEHEGEDEEMGEE
jgi:hypothetical protein